MLVDDEPHKARSQVRGKVCPVINEFIRAKTWVTEVLVRETINILANSSCERSSVVGMVM